MLFLLQEARCAGRTAHGGQSVTVTSKSHLGRQATNPFASVFYPASPSLACWDCPAIIISHPPPSFLSFLDFFPPPSLHRPLSFIMNNNNPNYANNGGYNSYADDNYNYEKGVAYDQEKGYNHSDVYGGGTHIEQVEAPKEFETQRSLKPRQISMIAIGGAIGESLFTINTGDGSGGVVCLCGRSVSLPCWMPCLHRWASSFCDEPTSSRPARWSTHSMEQCNSILRGPHQGPYSPIEEQASRRQGWRFFTSRAVFIARRHLAHLSWQLRACETVTSVRLMSCMSSFSAVHVLWYEHTSQSMDCCS